MVFVKLGPWMTKWFTYLESCFFPLKSLHSLVKTSRKVSSKQPRNRYWIHKSHGYIHEHETPFMLQVRCWIFVLHRTGKISVSSSPAAGMFMLQVSLLSYVHLRAGRPLPPGAISSNTVFPKLLWRLIRPKCFSLHEIMLLMNQSSSVCRMPPFFYFLIHSKQSEAKFTSSTIYCLHHGHVVRLITQ